MIERYTRAEMGGLWTPERRFHHMLEVEKCVAQVQGDLGLIPVDAARAIVLRARFSVPRILEIEATTQHDVIAFVTNVAEEVGENGKYVHFGLTSSDVLDTALSLQILQASRVIQDDMNKLLIALRSRVEQHGEHLCAGRTHGMHAEPTTLGFKLAGHYEEFARCLRRLKAATEGVRVAKLSGAVGTGSNLPPQFELKVAEALGLIPESIATQVVPRDRLAELFFAMALTGAAIERLALELRHLQRTEVGEIREGFSKGQKGSSAMPHKQNPISAENLTGVARLLRSYVAPALENVSLWHERDISHSSVERVILPDAFILLDYALARLTKLVSGFEAFPDKMEANMALSSGMLFSSHLLNALVEKGWTREEAYRTVQTLAHSLKPGETLQGLAQKDTRIVKDLGDKTLEKIFSGESHLSSIRSRLSKWLKETAHVV